MEITKGFYDFCIPYQSDHTKLKCVVQQLYDLGYRTIAIEQIYDHAKKTNSPKKSNDFFPPPIDLKFLEEFQSKLKILNRLTIIYSDVGVSHPMTNSSNLKKYNIIAGLPKNETALNHCCTTFSGDILCFNCDEGHRLAVHRKPYQVAVKRGMFFEFKYSDFITNSSIRRDMIKLAHNYHTKGKSRNIVISSNAKNIFELRSPYDIANLALIFGLSEEQGKSSVSTTCRQLCLRAESRRLGKTVMFGKKIYPNNETSEDENESSTDSQEAMEVEDNEEEASEQPIKRKKLS